MNPSKVDLKNSLVTLKSKKKVLLNKKKRIIKEINAIKIQEKKLRNELKINEDQFKLVVSMGFDKRWSTYNCIVKFKDLHFSFYLGKEKAIKNKLQQFHQKDISRRGKGFIKEEIKEIVRAVVPNHLKSGNSYKSVNFKKIYYIFEFNLYISIEL